MNIHFIAIGGAIMHSLAIALKQQGYTVSGSDDRIAEPALSNLKREGLLPAAEGFFAQKISPSITAVILGMHARADNPELLRAIELGIPVYSFPQYVYEVSKNKKRIVIAGSHGKTTITSMVMHVLRSCGLDIDYIVGARIKGFESGVRLSPSAPVIVLEGDEYLASPIERESKFMFYHPDVALISGIAWDHINVFPVYEDYVNQFRKFAATVAENGSIIYYAPDPELQKIFDNYSGSAKLLPYYLPNYEIRDTSTLLITAEGEYMMKVFGAHNMQNMEGARLVCREAGIGRQQFYEAMTSFEGAANRLEKLGENNHTAIYKDFAHSPSKLLATVQAMKEQYPGRRLVAVMELHTFSSLNKNFLHEYAGGLDAADAAAVLVDTHALNLKRMEPIDNAIIVNAFNRNDLKVLSSGLEMFTYLLGQDWKNTNLLLMSSGEFGGLDVAALVKEVLIRS